MKKESRRDNLLLSCSARRSLEGPSALPSVSSDDVDFQDVFGGPPRRFSLHETTRYSSDGVEETARSHSWSNEKPVFGGGSSINSRRHQNNNFFHDIFQGVKSRSSSGSVIMRQYETSGTSLPSQLSLLSATSVKAVDNLTFASTSTSNKKEDSSCQVGLSNYSLSRFSSQARPGHDLTSNVRPSNGPRPSSYVAQSVETVLTRGPKRDSDITKAQTDFEHSHFSMYKWAGTEIPLDDEVSSDVDEQNNRERWSNSDRRIRNNKDSNDTNNSYLPEKMKRGASIVTEKAPKPVPKTLHSFLHDDIQAEDAIDVTMKKGEKVYPVKTTKMKTLKVGTSKNGKKSDEERIDINSTEVGKGSIQRSSNIAEANVKKNGVGRKVKNFVKMFNQETYSKPKSNHGCQGQSFRSQGKGTLGEDDASNLSTSDSDAMMHFSNLNTMLDALAELNENVEKLERNHSHVDSPFFTTTDSSSIEKEASPCSELNPDYSEVRSDKIDNHFPEKYTMQELIGDQVKLLPTSEDHKAIKEIDDKILKWSTGKEGNIRSLISTLQYVLWVESGWKPVPLVNIIELNAVKKSYQRALLCLHPDKLQQKGADFQQTYIAEKVFDILQEAWDQFNLSDPFAN